MATHDELLARLEQLLVRLVSILRLDPKCRWTQKFETDLEQCQILTKDGSNKSEVKTLAISVMSVFQGMGSFSDYAPGIYDPSTGRYADIPGAEDFDSVIEEIFQIAIQLRASK